MTSTEYRGLTHQATLTLNVEELVMLLQALAADGSQQGRARAELLGRLREAIRGVRLP